MNFYNDPYYTPEKFNLQIVGEVDFCSGLYEFDLFVVWRKLNTGSLYYARNAGCSCPSPFEKYKFCDLTLATPQGIATELSNIVAKNDRYSYQDIYGVQAAHDLIAKVMMI